MLSLLKPIKIKEGGIFLVRVPFYPSNEFQYPEMPPDGILDGGMRMRVEKRGRGQEPVSLVSAFSA
jgi:hypothetical protein